MDVLDWAPIRDGARQRFRIHQGRWWTWDARITDVEPGRCFCDVQESGPFASWKHTHAMDQVGESCVLRDHVAYEIPVAPLGRWIAGGMIRRNLERTFDFRHRQLRADLERHLRTARRLRIAVSGASGSIGSALVPFLTSGGHTVLRLVRREARDGEVRWDPAAGTVDAAALEGVDAVIHLAGASIAKRWTDAHKRAIYDSRVRGTQLLANALAGLERKPDVFVSGSAIGIYGDRGSEALTEDSSVGTGFLSEVARDWEAAAAPAREAGIRVVNLRTGIVLTPKGGALGAQLWPARLGLSGPVAGGDQYFSWIAMDDIVGLIHHCLLDDAVEGPINATAPEPVPQREFARVLGSVLHRPAFAPVPGAAVRLALGEMGRETLLAGQRVLPRRARRHGFEFRFPTLREALGDLLGAAG